MAGRGLRAILALCLMTAAICAGERDRLRCRAHTGQLRSLLVMPDAVLPSPAFRLVAATPVLESCLYTHTNADVRLPRSGVHQAAAGAASAGASKGQAPAATWAAAPACPPAPNRTNSVEVGARGL